ncbi:MULTISPECIES: hypothetical protein [Citrobacter]|uniref:hypothetical protein n=1 Tax=Citrobacter TaxID=544 RepID=UPI00165DCC02|nr:hypothetical protein [Citrobacter braakii]
MLPVERIFHALPAGIARCLQLVLNAGLLLPGLILVAFLAKETLHLGNVLNNSG